VLEYNFKWKSLSAAAGLTAWNFYFRLYPGAVKSPQVLDFLSALVRHIRQPLLLVWDRLPAHRSAMVRDYIDDLKGQIRMEYLPPYAPELNPVEYIWAHWKQHELPNVCPKNYWQLSEGARRTLRRMRRRRTLITALKLVEHCNAARGMDGVPITLGGFAEYRDPQPQTRTEVA
jgi:transposase